MNDQEKKAWIKRNFLNFDSEKEASEYLEKRLSQEKAKKERVLKVFINLDEFRAYEKDHKMGRWWSYDADDFNGEYGPEYEDFVAVCAYEYND